ncbi:MAG: SLC13 family permease [Candidatus Eisenbacteria bacterium]|uniref:SLC13 family permease n=1 Tax=Eiseniibacteriota bacterium TaxID=2212470 RepID=A0A7Y2E914_UNCEI|nr:SLC13 family permease [Candidatus Eisenbacteria bacterium]
MEHLAVFAILIFALGFLIFSRLPADGVAMAVIVLLILTGTSTPAQALVGFAHPATLIVASVLLISAGIQRTGVVDGLALWMRRRAGKSQTKFLKLQTAIVTPMSAFLSNTAVVAVFLPLVLTASRDRGYSVSRLLMPLSFASLIGGMCTLIGTSTNVVVAKLAEDHGLGSIGMFDFVPIGIIIAIPGLLYLIYVAPRIVPDRRKQDSMTGDYHMRRYLTEVEVLPEAHLVGKKLLDSGLRQEFDLEVLEIERPGGSRFTPNSATSLAAGDVLLVSVPLNMLRQIQHSTDLRLRTEAKIDLKDLTQGGLTLAEAVVPPGSPLERRTLQSYNFRNRFGVTALALYHQREYIRERVGKSELRIGDTLLLLGTKERLRYLAGLPEVLSVVQVHAARPRRALSWIAVAILILTVGLAASGVLDLVKAVIGGAALMLVTGCLTVREAFRSVDRQTIFLLAGMISLGMAMERTGAASAFALNVIEGIEGLGPRGILAITYVVTAILTELLTNNATAVIMTPIAIAAAEDIGVSPVPFVFAVAYAASASFLSPVGYQTNMFIYGPGGYRFTDFFRVGLVLSLIAGTSVVWFAPMLWPF